MATTEEPSTDASTVAESESAAHQQPSASTAADGAVAMTEEPVAMTEEPAALTAHSRADEATNQPADDAIKVADEPMAEAAHEPPAEGHDEGHGQATGSILAETIETPYGDGKVGVREVSEPTPAESPEAPAEEEAEGVAESPVTEAVIAEQAIAETAAGDEAAAETDAAAEGVADGTEIDAKDPADTPADAAELVGRPIPPTDLEEAIGTAEKSAATPAFVESEPDTVDATGNEVAPAAQEEAAEAAGITEDSSNR